MGRGRVVALLVGAFMLGASVFVVGGCTLGKVDPEGEREAIIREHAEGNVKGVVGAYVSYGVDDVGAAEIYGLEWVEAGSILALPMDGVVELRTVARDLMGPRGEVASRSQFGGTEFTVDISKFFEIGGASAKLKEGYFEFPDLPDGKYLICHGKPVDAGELGIRVMHCARDLQVDRPAVVHVRKVSTEGGGFIVDVAPPPEDHGWW